VLTGTVERALRWTYNWPDTAGDAGDN
jgi:hypothetical protein